MVSDRYQLNNGLIRFHVVANSDSIEDQILKETVKDAVVQSLQADLEKIKDIQEAEIYLKDNLPKIQDLTDKTLKEFGFHGSSVVTLCKEFFDVRHYDTFSLPSGIYESLRITIGNGKGKNWWCVSFPTLCTPATTASFTDKAVEAGFSEPLAQTLAGNESYKIRFFLLDQLGKLENIFWDIEN